MTAPLSPPQSARTRNLGIQFGKLPLMVTLLSFAAVILAFLIWGFARCGACVGNATGEALDGTGLWTGGTYALIGVTDFAIKHNLDRLIASAVSHRKWGLFNYWIPPTRAIRITELAPEDRAFSRDDVDIGHSLHLGGRGPDVAAIALSGVAARMGHPVLRAGIEPVVLRSAERNAGGNQRRVIAPTPDGRRRSLLDRIIPDDAFGSAAIALLITVPVAGGPPGWRLLASGVMVGGCSLGCLL